ncbi:MAG: EAL domain-containing protein [Butyrivibrio sp.]|nr:EAL domain-containing protein [Butyrivibrio sp.]
MGRTAKKEGLENYYPKESFLKKMNKKAESHELTASFCCVYFYITGFRAYYMSHGFDNGYSVLVKTARLIDENKGDGDICHIIDNEFAIIAGKDDITNVIDTIQKAFDEEFVHTNLKLIAGIYYFDENADSLHQAILYARTACFQGENSQATVYVYDKIHIDETTEKRNYVVARLDKAIEEGDILVYYQPIFHTLSGRICGFEALARWHDEKYGMIMPKDFVYALERARKIHLLDIHVIKQVCRDLQSVTKSENVPPVPISVNLTRMDFALTDMLQVIERELKNALIPRALLQIEISESEIDMDREGIKKELIRFHEHGFRIVFDDFGSQYSSLQILNELPFDAIKINSSFLSGYDNSSKSKIMMKNVLNMAKELGINTMMGSVEDQETLDFLKRAGCEKTQGHLYSEAAPFGQVVNPAYAPENIIERAYYDSIANINTLSQNPLDIGGLYLEDEDTYLNQMPLALIDYCKGKFNFLMVSDSFGKMFEPLFHNEVASVSEVFNSEKGIFAKQIRALAEVCVDDDVHPMEFVTSEGFHRIVLKRIATDMDHGKVAFIATAETITENDPGKRAVKLNSALRFLYMLYNRVDLVMVEKNSYETVFENHTKYAVRMKKGSFSNAIEDFAKEAIYNEDREKFINFYSLETLEERLREYNVDHLTDYFRTKDTKGKYDWLMYMIIPIVSEGSKMFLLCSRGIDSERMRKLPEISQSGSVYYDMPSDPAFLLLASDAFTDTLGYGSFEQFIRNSFYLEASLSDNKTVYMHLGQSGLISDFGETGNIELPFDEVTKSMVFSQVIEDDREKMYEFYNRERLLAEYENGKLSGNTVYLQRTGSNVEPRYQIACYQIRKARDNDSIKIYILTYDVDEFKRTNEKIKRLAERDNLTGLYNRATIGNFVDSLMSNEDTVNFAVVLLDLDYFKHINDRFGHDCGDAVLKDAANKLRTCMGDHSIPARIGGDEFLTIIVDQGREEIEAILSKFSAMEKKVVYHDQEVVYTMSIGYSMYPDHGKKYKHLYQNADLALYQVKMNGRNSYGGYVEGIAVEERAELGFNPASISEGIPGGFLVYKADKSEEILFANKKLLEIYECESFEEFMEFTKGSFKGCVHEGDYKLIEKIIAKEIKRDDGYDYVQYRAITRNGTVKVLEDYGRLLHSTTEGDLFYVFLLDYNQKRKLYKSVVDDIHKHWEDE